MYQLVWKYTDTSGKVHDAYVNCDSEKEARDYWDGLATISAVSALNCFHKPEMFDIVTVTFDDGGSEWDYEYDPSKPGLNGRPVKVGSVQTVTTKKGDADVKVVRISRKSEKELNFPVECLKRIHQ